MAGRAGRRGLDKVGTVIMCCFGETPPPQQILRTMLTGRSTTLRSQFRLTYNMILNLLRVEEMSVESMIKRSFSEFATQRALTANDYPKLLSRGTNALQKLEEEAENEEGNRIGADDIEEYFQVCRQILETNKDVLNYIKDSGIQSYDDIIQPGRVLLVSAARRYGVVRAPAVVIRAKSPAAISVVGTARAPDDTNLVCLVLLPASHVQQEDSGISGTVGYVGMTKQRYYGIFQIDLNQILVVASSTRKGDDMKKLLKEDSKSRGHPGFSQPQNLLGAPSERAAADPFAGKMALGKKGGRSTTQGGDGGSDLDIILASTVAYLLEVEQMELREGGFPVADLQKHIVRGNHVVEYRQACDRIHELTAAMRSFQSHSHPNLKRWYQQIERRETLREKVDTLRHLLSNESLSLFPDFLQRKAVLMKLNYVDKNETVCVKGRVACEVNTCEELIATEMVFEGILNDLAPEEIVAVLSALVYQEKKDETLGVELPERLVKCCEAMKTIATNLGQLQKEQGLDVDPLEYADGSLKFGLVHVVYEWALGVPFDNICQLTDAQEGSIVRCITRLDELCRELRNCARVVGNPTLYRKLEAASTSIKRDIVFASSLYVS